MAIGLRTAASGSSVGGIEESSLRALAKLDQILPPALRRRVGAVHTFTVPVPGYGPVVDAEALCTIAGACRDRLELRFGYGTHDGTRSRRVVEPHRMVHLHGRWYLVAWDRRATTGGPSGSTGSPRAWRSAAAAPAGSRRAPIWPPTCGARSRRPRGRSRLRGRAPCGRPPRARLPCGGPPPPAGLPAARRELVRRFLRAYGPSTHSALASWAQTSPAYAKRLFAAIADGLSPVRLDGAKRWVLTDDLERLRDPPAATGVRLLTATTRGWRGPTGRPSSPTRPGAAGPPVPRGRLDRGRPGPGPDRRAVAGPEEGRAARARAGVDGRPRPPRRRAGGPGPAARLRPRVRGLKVERPVHPTQVLPAGSRSGPWPARPRTGAPSAQAPTRDPGPT